MKRIVCTVALTCVLIGAVFAQARPATPPAQPAKPPAQPAKPAAAPAAATSEAKNALGLDLFQLFKGLIASDSDSDLSFFIVSAGYERLVAPHYSFGVDLDIYFIKLGKTDGNYFSIAAEGRYYPMSENFEKLFVGVTLGYNQLSIDGKSKPENGGFSGLTTSLKVGYKIIANKLYMEPSLAYVLSKTSISSMFGVPTPLGWNGGFRLGFLF
jgi:hypothetical protein